MEVLTLIGDGEHPTALIGTSTHALARIAQFLDKPVVEEFGVRIGQTQGGSGALGVGGLSGPPVRPEPVTGNLAPLSRG